MTESRKWIDLYPGETHEFGTRVRIGHARMNDNAVRLYYEEIEAVQLGPTHMVQEAEQTTVKKPEKPKREK
jgi:hypothetical protein